MTHNRRAVKGDDSEVRLFLTCFLFEFFNVFIVFVSAYDFIFFVGGGFQNMGAGIHPTRFAFPMWSLDSRSVDDFHDTLLRLVDIKEYPLISETLKATNTVHYRMANDAMKVRRSGPGGEFALEGVVDSNSTLAKLKTVDSGIEKPLRFVHRTARSMASPLAPSEPPHVHWTTSSRCLRFWYEQCNHPNHRSA